MNTNRLEELAALDRAHLVHPVAAWRQHEARGPLLLTGARGAWLTDGQGHELLDAFAGLWCVNVGYGQESVVQAATAQLRQLPYATGYFGFASEPAIRLAAKLAEITPASLTRAYLTLGGSEAVDAAVRFIVQYWNARGRPTKKHFIALERGYHGSSSTGAGLTALPVFHRGFDLPLATQHHIPSPNPYRHPQGGDAQALIAASVADAARQGRRVGRRERGGVLLRTHPGFGRRHRAARRLAEGHAGRGARARHPVRRRRGHHRLRPHRADVRLRRRRCAARPDDAGQGLDLGLRADGRDHALGSRSTPTIADGAPAGAPIGHGATYSAHPVAAAVALEVLRLYEEGGVLANGQRVAPRFAAGLEALRAHPLVGDARHRGLLGALELVSDKATKRAFDPALGLPDRVFAAAWRNGVVFRCFGDATLGFAPALTYTEADFDQLFARLTRTLDDVLAAARGARRAGDEEWPGWTQSTPTPCHDRSLQGRPPGPAHPGAAARRTAA